MCTPVMCAISSKQLLQSLDNNNDCCSGFSFTTNSCFLPVSSLDNNNDCCSGFSFTTNSCFLPVSCLDNNNDCCSGFSFATNSCFLPVDTRREEQLKEMECMLMISQWSKTKNSFKSVLRQNMSAVPQCIFPPSEAQFPKEQTSIYKAFKNTAIVTGLVSYILTLFSLDILSANIFFFYGL